MKRYIPAMMAALMLTGCAGTDTADTGAVQAETTEATISAVQETLSETTVSSVQETSAETSAVPDMSDITAGLVYDESDNTWANEKEEYSKFVNIMKYECAKSPDIKGTYLLANDDEIIFIGGINSVDIYGNKADAHTVYETGSVTKTFTATAVLQLIEEGKLSFDDTLDKFFPEYEYGKDITIYQLLHMRSGIRREFFDDSHGLIEGDTNNEAFEEWKKFYRDGYTDEELLAELFAAKPQFEPDAQHLYSNAGYTLLAMIIEQVTGESYAEYIQKNIFDICGMEHSSSMTVGDVTGVPEPVPEDMYAFDIYDLTPTGYMSCPRTDRGCGDIHTCAADMLAFDRALIGGRLINEDSLEEMFKMDIRYGCGWEKFGGDYTAIATYCHAGATHFFRAFNVYYRTEKYGNVYLITLHPTSSDSQYITSCVSGMLTALSV